MRNRTAKELLIVLKNHIEIHGVISGICELIPTLTINKKINSDEAEILNRYLILNLPYPESVWYYYCWEKGLEEPRIEWLNKQIENYEK